MADNKRIYYAVQQLGMAVDGSQTFLAAHGVQSIGLTTTFNLEQVFELGQLAIYDLVENIPDIEMTAEKVLDGSPLLYHLATNGAPNGSLVGRSNVKTIAALSVFTDVGQSCSGTPIAEVQMSGLLVSSLTYTFPVTGRATEAVTLVGNTKVWRDMDAGGVAAFSGAYPTGDDLPASTGVQSRWDMLFDPISGSPTGLDGNGQTKAYMTVVPTDLYGVTSSGTVPVAADGTLAVPLQNIAISCDLGRDAIYELGRKSPYFRYVTFPVEVKTDIETLAIKMDNISADEVGGHNGAPAGSNLKFQTIRVQMRDGTRIDVGTRNKLTSVQYQGGDAASGGGNVTNRYSYVTYNTLSVYHPADPSALPFVYGA